MSNPEIIVILHNIRSTHNVGAIFRTCEGLGVSEIICSGYTPYPKIENDSRLPHIAEKLHDQITKTALGSESIVPFKHAENPDFVSLRENGFKIVALEQTPDSITLSGYMPPEKIALIVGEEVNGIPLDILSSCDDFVEIPMRGKKESFNVSVATGMALYEFLGRDSSI